MRQSEVVEQKHENNSQLNFKDRYKHCVQINNKKRTYTFNTASRSPV